MTPPQATPQADQRQDPFRWQRLDSAGAFSAFADPFEPPLSQREYARQHGIPRSTLGYWLRQDAPADLDSALVCFLRSRLGEEFLRRVVLAVLLVFHHLNACGLRQIGLFLRLAQLDRFVASSYGALHGLAARLQSDLALFGLEEGQRLAPLMSAKTIILCPDENFHGPQPCLVAIEGVSDFIVVETYCQSRDGQAWTEAITQGTQGLPVEVIGLTSDQAKGLIAAAGNLQAQHTPELFHGLRDLAGPLCAPLQRQATAAQKEFEQARQLTQHWQQHRDKAQAAPPRPGRPRDFEWRVLLAASAERHAAQRLQGCQQRQQQAVGALRGLADDYHPFDPQTGQPLTAQQVEQRLGQRLETLREVAQEAQLGERAAEAVGKAGGWLAALVASLAWFWGLTRRRLEELSLSEQAEKAFEEKLLAGLYWQQAAGRARTAQERQRKKELAEGLLKEAWSEGGALSALTEQERQEVARAAREIAGLFQRSSSCVEGRNGRLALFHHGHSGLSEGRLKALTAVHNYVVKRADGSTAAERFFGVKQRDAFSWLLARLPELPRPAAKRPKRPPQPATLAG